MKKIEMTLEVLMPTQVTKIVEFPIFYKELNGMNSFIAIDVDDMESVYVPYKIIEVVEYSDTRKRVYIKNVGDKEVSSIIAHADAGGYQQIDKEFFKLKFINAIDEYMTTIENI